MLKSAMSPRVVFLVVIALIAGVWVSANWFAPEPRPTAFQAPPATVLPQPRPLGPFALTDHHGQPFDESRLEGHWTFMFFGYTHCPDVCPNTLGVLKIVHDQLNDRLGTGDDVRFVFVSVDPERDSVSQLSQYVPYFDEEFLGVTGAGEQIDVLTRQLGIVYMRTPGGASDEDYLVDHTAAIMLVSPRAEWYALFSAPHEPRAIADAFLKIHDHYGRS